MVDLHVTMSLVFDLGIKRTIAELFEFVLQISEIVSAPLIKSQRADDIVVLSIILDDGRGGLK